MNNIFNSNLLLGNPTLETPSPEPPLAHIYWATLSGTPNNGWMTGTLDQGGTIQVWGGSPGRTPVIFANNQYYAIGGSAAQQNFAQAQIFNFTLTNSNTTDIGSITVPAGTGQGVVVCQGTYRISPWGPGNPTAGFISRTWIAMPGTISAEANFQWSGTTNWVTIPNIGSYVRNTSAAQTITWRCQDDYAGTTVGSGTATATILANAIAFLVPLP